MIPTPSKVVLLLLVLPLILASALATAIIDQVQGECNSDTSDGSCDAASDAADADALPAPDGDLMLRTVTPACEDKESECGFWASEGECENNPNYMLLNCAISCKSCPSPFTMSIEDENALKAVEKYGKPQRVEGADGIKTLEVIRKTVAYMENDIFGPSATHTLSEMILAECTNKEDLCAFWAAIGECEANKSYMKTKCAPSCQTCDMIDMNVRCPPLDEDVRPGLLPGELNAMFERIVTTAPGNSTDNNIEIEDGMRNYTVHVHSRPGPLKEDQESISIFRDLEEPPWVITFDNFMSAEECEHLIELGYKSKYERSEDVGEIRVDGSFGSVQSAKRTSENAWCSYKSGCRSDPVVQRIHERIAKLTGIPANHSEDFQVLKYESGQFYRNHHDYIGIQRDRRCGPRILTFFLYLSDVEGGATNFTKLDIAVTPKLGRALLWPSVLNSNPKDEDPRTYHEAQDVVTGTKFAANSWIHLHDYMAASDMGCT